MTSSHAKRGVAVGNGDTNLKQKGDLKKNIGHRDRKGNKTMKKITYSKGISFLAEEYYQKGKLFRAKEMFAKTAEKTGDLHCVLRTIELHLFFAKYGLSVIGETPGVEDMIFYDTKSAYKWIRILMKDKEIMRERGSEIRRQYQECRKIGDEIARMQDSIIIYSK